MKHRRVGYPKCFYKENAIEFLYSTEDILDLYWHHWQTAMERQFNKSFPKNVKNVQQCVEYFVITNWASEVR